MNGPNFKITAVWIVLCFTTAVSVGASGASSSAMIGVAVLGAAFLKVYLVMHYFMELDNAPRSWQLGFTGWVLVVFLLLSTLLLKA